MKVQIRKNIFETNSSSVHAICIATEDEFERFPSEVVFNIGEFGWENEEYYDLGAKAAYLWTAILNYTDEMSGYDVETCKEKITSALEEVGVKAIFIDTIPGESCSNTGYIDHGYELDEFIRDVVGNKDRLYQYLFSDGSYVATGNDNDGTEPDINKLYPHETYKKGN